MEESLDPVQRAVNQGNLMTMSIQVSARLKYQHYLAFHGDPNKFGNTGKEDIFSPLNEASNAKERHVIASVDAKSMPRRGRRVSGIQREIVSGICERGGNGNRSERRRSGNRGWRKSGVEEWRGNGVGEWRGNRKKRADIVGSELMAVKYWQWWILLAVG